MSLGDAARDSAATNQQFDVGIITSHMSFDHHGGSNYSRHRFGQELKARGHSATIYTLNFADENHIPIEHDYELVEDRIDARTVLDGSATFYRRISKYFDSHDVVHVYVPGIIPFFGAYRRQTGDETPLVGHLNGYTPFCSQTARMRDGCWEDCNLLKKLKHARDGPVGNFTTASIPRHIFNDVATVPLMNQLDRLFCLSPSVKQIYEDVGVNPEILEVSPNMTDPTFASAESQETENTRILYVGRVDAMKNVGNLLEAISYLETDGWHVDIVGDNILNYGQGLDDYRKDAADLGIDDRVTFHGWVDYTELSEYYARGDVFVHPAEWPEPFGRTIIEAMGHGLPIVCSDVGAPPWVSGSAGVPYPKDSPRALAHQLDFLIECPDRRDALAANTAIELERFDPDRVMARILDTYAELSL